MVASIGSSDSNMQMLMAQMYAKMNKADTDGTSGLSKDEMSSIDTSDDVGGAAFLQSLNDQFSTLDTDQNGQLSSDEISKAKPTQQQDAPMGPPPGMMIEGLDSSSSTSSSSDSSSSDTYSDLLNSLVDSITSSLDTNKDGTVSLEELQNAISGGKSDNATDSSATTADASNTTSNSGDSSSSSFGDTLKDLSGNFLQKLISSYTNNSAISSAISAVL